MRANWIRDTNRWNLAAPPVWWLQKLHDVDADLVVIPSRLRRAYVLARRRRRSLTMPKSLQLDTDMTTLLDGSDGDMLASRKLIHVEYLLGYGTWGDTIFHQLRQRDTWAAGGASRLADRLDEADAAVRAKTRQQIATDMEYRAADAWRSLQARTGARNQRSGSGPKVTVQHVGTL